MSSQQLSALRGNQNIVENSKISPRSFSDHLIMIFPMELSTLHFYPWLMYHHDELSQDLSASSLYYGNLKSKSISSLEVLHYLIGN